MNCKETLLEYALGKKLRAFSTTRLGGTGTNQYATFNITPYCGDDAANVLANQTDLCHELGIDEKHLILPHQNHRTGQIVCPSFFMMKKIMPSQLSMPDGVVQQAIFRQKQLLL